MRVLREALRLPAAQAKERGKGEMMHHYRVGQPYSKTRTRWPQGGDYNVRNGEHEFRLFLPDVEPREIQQVARGKAEFALVPYAAALFLLYKFGTMPWSDTTYHYAHTLAALPEEAPAPEPLQDGQRFLLNVILVEANTGLIKALRSVSLSPAFSRELQSYIAQQAKMPFDDGAEKSSIQHAYANYKTADAMLTLASARCIGGE